MHFDLALPIMSTAPCHFLTILSILVLEMGQALTPMKVHNLLEAATTLIISHW